MGQKEKADVIRAAMYSRVSSDRQEQEQTIQSQRAELRARVEEDGVVNCQDFSDEGYGRDNLVRPVLDRLRDLVAQGEIDRLYVQCPDRLASGARLILLVEEFQQHGVEVVFLKGSVDETPEGKLLLHMQGAIAEYERTKIAERTRRGRLHKARAGILQGGHAPYGYIYIKRDGERPGSLSVRDDEAEVVQMAYRWLVEEQLSLRGIARRLTEWEVAAPGGGSIWRSGTIGRMLSYEVYAGTGYYNKRQKAVPQRYKTAKQYRKDAKSSFRRRPREEWLAFPAPALVDRETWERAQAQLQQNAHYSRRNNKRFQYLLKGLVRCGSCDRPLTGQSQGGRSYYRHNWGETPWLQKPCPHKRGYRQDILEPLVWEAVADALRRPELLVHEYQRRNLQNETPEGSETHEKQLDLALRRLKAQEDRLIDAYKNEAIDLSRLKEEMGKLRARREAFERERNELNRLRREQIRGADVLVQLEAFCERVAQGLDDLNFEERQKLLRLVVDCIVVNGQRIRIEGIIPMQGGTPDVALSPTRPVD